MSRTHLCFATVALLAGLATATACLRFYVVGADLHLATAAEGFRVTLLVRGQGAGRAAIINACPPIFGQQHICNEICHSDDFTAAALHPDDVQRFVRWEQHSPSPAGTLRASYEFQCNVSVRRPTPEMDRSARRLYRPPVADEYLQTDHDPLAAELTYGIDAPHDKAQALFQYADQALAERDPQARARRLVLLCRNCGIPARLVHGLTLGKNKLLKPHIWVEAFASDTWLSLCPTHHFCGRVPASFLVLCHGDEPPVRTENLRDVEFIYLIDQEERDLQESESLWRHLFHAASVHRLPLADWRLVDFLLLMPLAALLVCFFRNVIGMPSFGIFAPALIGMAFRETAGMPGVVIFCTLVVAGWGVRRALDCYHLLQAPRTAVLLTLLAVILLAAILAAHHLGLTVAHYISLIPMVILAGMVERFWTQEVEESTAASLRTLLSTMFIAGTVGAITSLPAVVECFMDYPESLGLVIAGQMLIGRYTGYRLSELLRFRDLVDQPMSRL